MNNDDKLREQMKSEPVPDRLRPENIKIMLDNEAPKKKRSGISVAGRMTAAAAAFAVIGGTSIVFLAMRIYSSVKSVLGVIGRPRHRPPLDSPF